MSAHVFNKFLQAALTLSTVITLSACTKTNSRVGIDPAADRKASAAVADSFHATTTDSDKNPKSDIAQVTISRSAFEKEFLLSTNMLSELPTPMFNSLQSRVVYFTIKNNHVYMLEATPGKVVGENNIEAFLPLAEFEILSQTPENVTIDFNLGMKKIITAADMSTLENTEPASWTAVTVNFSFLQEVKIDKNQFFIRQVAQVQTDKLMPLEIRYYLAPYNPDPEFIPTLSPLNFYHVGYFEANPLLDTHGNTIRYAMKFNQNKPIVFAISANTPDDYKETVRNGILYWNKSLGENKVQVIELTDSKLTAPNPDYNIVQWANWDTAGYAYADAHIDPRSGEVTHAQVFFPSAFTQAAVEKRVRVLQGSRKQFGLLGFQSAQLCRRNVTKEFATALETVTGSAAITKEAMQKAVKDYIFEVIAHEVGHVLGLRHNFAGNLAANYDASERRELALSYYKNKKAPAGIISSSSVMEYSRFEESSWNGDKLQNGSLALSHDYITINYLYNKKDIPENAPPFCTDSQIDTFADCNMSDASKSIVSYSIGNYRFGIETLPVRILNQFISESKISDDPGLPLKPVESVLLNANAAATGLAIDRYKFLSLLKNEVRLIQVRAPLQPLWPSLEPKTLALEKDFISSEVKRLGGISSVIDLSEKDLANVWITQFNNLLADTNFNQGEVNNKTFSFSKSEKEIMQQQFNLFAQDVQNQLIKQNLKALSGESISFEQNYGQTKKEITAGWFENNLTNELAAAIQNISNHYIFSANETKEDVGLTFKDGSIKTTQLSIYTYSHDIRKAAAAVWSAPAVAIDWAYLEKPMNAAQISAELENLGEADKIDFTKTNNFVLRWLLQNKEIEKTALAF